MTKKHEELVEEIAEKLEGISDPCADIGLQCHECQFAERYINPDDRIIEKAFCRLGRMQVDEYGRCVIPDRYVESIYPKRLYGVKEAPNDQEEA